MSNGTKIKTTIELNGQLYDVRTGKVISPAAFSAAHSPPPKPVTAAKPVDVFIRQPAKLQQPVGVNRVPAPKPGIARPAPSHARTKLEKSRTLMRPAVKKPQALIQHQPQTHHRFKKEDPARKQRAAAVEKSAHIHRFHPLIQHKIVRKEAVLPVVRPASQAQKQISQQVAHLATSTEAKVKQSVDIVEESLRSASAHLETFEDNVAHSSFWTRFGFRHKAANLASLSFAGVLLIGFFAYQNAPNLEMRMAAASSGVSATMPGYKPAGFSAQRNVKSEPGKVSVTFRSNTDDKNFTLTQQASNWSSEALLSNQVLASRQPYQTYRDGGKTIYIYENSKATWVNGGIWYQVDGDASLTSDQMLRIASSL